MQAPSNRMAKGKRSFDQRQFHLKHRQCDERLAAISAGARTVAFLFLGMSGWPWRPQTRATSLDSAAGTGETAPEGAARAAAPGAMGCGRGVEESDVARNARRHVARRDSVTAGSRQSVDIGVRLRAKLERDQALLGRRRTADLPSRPPPAQPLSASTAVRPRKICCPGTGLARRRAPDGTLRQAENSAFTSTKSFPSCRCNIKSRRVDAGHERALHPLVSSDRLAD